MSSFREPLSERAVRAALVSVPFVQDVVYLPSAGSTNDIAHGLAAQGVAGAVLVATDDQVAGRGRLGRTWYMPPRSSLAMSILVRPDLPAAQANRLTMLAGLAAAEGVEQVTRLSVRLKWPNDVVIDAESGTPNSEWRKLGGILTETAIAADRIEYAVVGIGLNVNVDFVDQPELAETATSLLLRLGREVDRLSVLAAIVERFASRFDGLKSGDALRAAWSARLVTLGRRVQAEAGDRTFAGLAEAVDADGALLLRTGDGVVHRLLAADVTLQK